jgi:hypothetical protein
MTRRARIRELCHRIHGDGQQQFSAFLSWDDRSAATTIDLSAEEFRALSEAVASRRELIITIETIEVDE